MKKFLKDMESTGFEPKQAFAFKAKAGYVPQKGDRVALTTTVGEVEPAADGKAVRGLVDVVYEPLNGHRRLTVSLFGQRADTATAKGAVAPNDDLVSAGGNLLRKFVTGTDKPEAIVGFALTSAADAEQFEIVYK
ncbi:hypothetical protein IHN63_00555 [Deinococcus sp. 6YEL10]|uniref:hypothetical protein n=1 Tax=Deinococcus sp. 6YEL10 TaxID=2745870 RepID=UPI001E395BFC|nr:hypothetical protein [Deinococcus sp. 6YEL10]MCD0159790.1 hypothetical protein [Deinococcus sp. 6YEL10]